MTTPTGVCLDPVCVEHVCGAHHPERPERLETLFELLASDEAVQLALRTLPERLATGDDIVRVHAGTYFGRVARTEGRRVSLDPDTGASPRSYEAALRAAGAALAATDAVLDGDVRNAFAIVRPPGHHAEQSRAMGFCLFNNVAIAAAYARATRGIERIAIIDFDVHHGNGTMHSFWDDPKTLYISSHQYPFFPGTGAYADLGGEGARGATVNFPLRGGHGDTQYDAIYGMLVSRVLEQFEPELMLVSAGYDVMASDPLGSMRVTESGIGAISGHLVAAAERICDGRLVALLEGGYDLDGLRTGVLETLRTMVSRAGANDPLPEIVPSQLGDVAQYLSVLADIYSF